MNCPNCGNKLSCGCQQRTASDGTKVCTSCLNSYEAKLLQRKKVESALIKNNQNFEPTVLGVKYNPPKLK